MYTLSRCNNVNDQQVMSYHNILIRLSHIVKKTTICKPNKPQKPVTLNTTIIVRTDTIMTTIRENNLKGGGVELGF